MAGQVDVSIILCAYNEAHIIVDAIRNIERVMDGNGLEYEIILVDDGSFDGTRDKALEYSRVNCNGRLKVIGYERNMGKGHAIRVGFEHSSGDKVVFIDGDLDVSPNYIPHYVKALEHYDVVIGSKWHPKSKVKTTFKRRLLSFGFNVFSRMLTGIKLRDTQTGLKAFRRSVLERVFPKVVVKRFAFDLELMAMCNHSGFRIAEMPVNVNINHMADFEEILRMALDTMRVAYRLRVLKIYQHS